MNQLCTFMKKEFAQLVREYTLIWLPLVFIVLGLTQPIVSYYLPSILKAVGGEQGIIIDPNMTVQEGGEVLATTLGSQFDQLGIMIIVISMMGIVQSDKVSGMLSFILSRPVSPLSYLSGKITSNYIVVACSVSLGFVISIIYTNILFTSLPNIVNMVIALSLYLLWVLIMIAITTLISTVFRSIGFIALLSIILLLTLRMIVGMNPILDLMNPANMSKYAMDILINGSSNVGVDTKYVINLASTCGWLVITVAISNYWLRNKKSL